MHRLVMFSLLSLLVLPATATAADDRGLDPKAAAIQSVLTEVRDSLLRVQKTLKAKKYPPLSAITLTLQTVAVKEVGGQVKLWIFSAGSKVSKEASQEVVIQLTPPSADNPSKVSSGSFTDALESAIMSAVDGAQTAGDATLPLKFSGLDVTIGFTVKGNIQAGAKLELLPITVDLSGSVANTAVQTLKVSFGKTK